MKTSHELAMLLLAGNQMSNVIFNLGQNSGMLKEYFYLSRYWDEAKVKYLESTDKNHRVKAKRRR